MDQANFFEDELTEEMQRDARLANVIAAILAADEAIDEATLDFLRKTIK